MKPTNVTMGIDLGDRRHAVCVLAEETIANTCKCLSAFAHSHPGAVFAMETFREAMPRTQPAKW